jgi:hypothetical protein
MRSPLSAGRPRFSLKASHRRMSLKVSHRRDPNTTVVTAAERERYIAPPKRRR